jgi:hypothetical protein
MSSVDTFTTDTRSFYDNRCIFCLTRITIEGTQYAHVLDASEEEIRSVVEWGSELKFADVFHPSLYTYLGVIPQGYYRSAAVNGVICEFVAVLGDAK